VNGDSTGGFLMALKVITTKTEKQKSRNKRSNGKYKIRQIIAKTLEYTHAYAFISIKKTEIVQK